MQDFTFEPGAFLDVYNQPEGRRLLDWIRERENIVRMETATYLRRPAVEPLQPGLALEFGPALKANRFRQFVGFVARQVLAHIGYELQREEVRIRFGSVFVVAARYQPQG